MNDPYEQEIAELWQALADVTAQLAKRDGNIADLKRQIHELKARIRRVEHERDFFKDQNNINLADNRHLRDRLYRNPYSDDFYNEN